MSRRAILLCMMGLTAERGVIRGRRGGPLKPPPPAESCSCPTSTA